MNTPTNLKYSKDHEWVRMEGEFAYVGITDFAQSDLGEIVEFRKTRRRTRIGEQRSLRRRLDGENNRIKPFRFRFTLDT